VNAVTEDLETPAGESGASERQTLAARLSELLERHDGAEEPGLLVDARSRIALLKNIFGLSRFEADVVAVLWVVAFDSRLRAALVAGDRFAAHPTPRGIARLLGHDGCLRLASESPLRTWRIVDEHPMFDGSAAVALDPHIVAWLEHEKELDRALCGHAHVVTPDFELPSWPLDRITREVADGVRGGLRWRICLDSDDRRLAEVCAAAVARRLGLPLLAIDGANGREFSELRLRAHRQAFLDGSALFFGGFDGDDNVPSPFPVQFFHGCVPRERGDVRELTVRLPAPDREERSLLWRASLPECARWPSTELDALSRHPAGAADIARAAAAAPADSATAIEILRAVSRDDIEGLAQRIDAHFGWDDLVVTAAVRERLEEISFEARSRGDFWSRPEAARLYPQGRGLVALFAGPPGTGKTMAAQVIAAELGLDLWRVDVSAILSKWVGETAQHLQKILSARTARRAVLFFDEADALYGKRVEEVRDAQDRFANMDVSHLMVALEAYDGIILMATNLRTNIDAAFMRRIRHVVEFARPDESARRAIWRRVSDAVFGAAAPTDIDLARLSRLDCTGAQIKNAALSAVFAARRLDVAPDKLLIGRMLARELAKDGAGISVRDLDDALGVNP
jgi:adenylate kinase family enzyme